ncbi:TrkH family potassium uptake protein [Rhodophyticola porphyridii]|uniref:Trk system potassium uptake protein n=1 Tax=Rhodophyticola porphyridii TaxID=1852017 RepID=A0A3L9YK81_9RHOB|nr:TrkH family potassium uptake protein [Rhodophyticola porphyridii]RMA43210.1 TrkH family potassium uptake protein [Rhodophyticola porphyridii]
MFDLRPVGYVLGLLVSVLGATMLLPLGVDLYMQNGHWQSFAEAALITIVIGVFLTLACANAVTRGLTLQQTFLLTTGVWLVLPVFGALPFVFGATEAAYVDAFFEAMSGLTTTGSTVLTGLDQLPEGILLWRGLLQWFGGIGIIVVAMVFLPELRVGGMQIFRSEGFDTFGKILPRATEIASRIWVIYLTLTLCCAAAYATLGMDVFDAIVHAMTTVATGGFANSDASFGAFGPGVEYAAVVFMLLAALPFVRYVQLVAGSARPLWIDSQIRAFFLTVLALVSVMTLWLVLGDAAGGEFALRKALFNTVSIVTGTGYASADYMQWGAFAVVVFFFAGLIGGCAGSTSCSIKVFRYQLLMASISTQVKRLYAPHGIFEPRYQGRPVAEDVLNSVMAFFVLFFVTLGVVAVLLGLTGLDFITAVSGAATALGNIGPGLGPVIGPAGTFAELNDTAKWILSAAMLIGRLELMAVFVLFTAAFWRT